MSRLDRYILSSQLRAFGFFSIILLMVYWVNNAAILFDTLIGDGQSVAVFLEFSALTLPSIIFFVLPMSTLIATLFATNRLINDSELIIARAAGYGAVRLSWGVFLYGLIVALFMSAVAHFLQPTAAETLAEKRDEISRDVAAQFLDEGVFLHPTPGITFYIREINARGELLDIFLSDSRSDATSTIYTAKRAILIDVASSAWLLMYDGLAQSLSLGEATLATTRFDELSYDMSALIDTSGFLFPKPQELTTADLLSLDPAMIEAAGATPAEFLTTAHLRFTQPAFAIVVALLSFAAMMTGHFNRLGNWRQIGLGVALVLALKSFDNFVVGLSYNDATMWPTLYAPTVLGTLITVLVLWITERPALFKRRRAA